MRRNNSSKFFNFNERQWDWSDQASCTEPPHDPGSRCAVNRLFSGTPQLPRLCCRPSPQDGPQPRRIRPCRSLGTLPRYISDH
ncbi:uncharacterized protein ACO6RY_14105 [Pungitius sinensis]